MYRYLKCDLSTFDLQDLESKFDVIFVEPPLEEYKRTVGKVHDRCWSWEEVSDRCLFYSDCVSYGSVTSDKVM